MREIHERFVRRFARYQLVNSTRGAGGGIAGALAGAVLDHDDSAASFVKRRPSSSERGSASLKRRSSF